MALLCSGGGNKAHAMNKCAECFVVRSADCSSADFAKLSPDTFLVVVSAMSNFWRTLFLKDLEQSLFYGVYAAFYHKFTWIRQK
jgi:hypothetical protein